MGAPSTADILKITPLLLGVPHGEVWSSYDREADVLYVTFKQPAEATDSELTDDDVVLRYEDEEIIGMTIFRASTR